MQESLLPIVALLLFYLGYTVLYGLSILALSEGLGISASHGGEKKEA